MTTDFRALCAGYEPGDGSMDGAQLVDGEWWHPTFGCDSLQLVVDRARAALAEPQPEPPTDDGIIPNRYSGYAVQIYRDGFHAGYRLALTRVDLAKPQSDPPADGEVDEAVSFARAVIARLEKP